MAEFTITFTADDIINAPPLPPITHPNDPRAVLLRKIEEDVIERCAASDSGSTNASETTS